MDSRNPGQAASSRLAGSRVARGAILAVCFRCCRFKRPAAHDSRLKQPYASETLQKKVWRLQLTAAVRDARKLAELDEDHDGIVTQAEFARTRSQLGDGLCSDGNFSSQRGWQNRPRQLDSQRLDGNNNVEVCLNFHAVGFFESGDSIQDLASLPLGHRQVSPDTKLTRGIIFERLF
jgi:hypothetical protein